MSRIFIALLSVCFTPCAEAQQDSLLIRAETVQWIRASDALLIIPSSLIVIMNHELGHFTMASVFGAQNVRIGLFRSKAIGWTQWSGDLGGFGNSAAFLGGVLFSRGLAEGSDCIIRNADLPPLYQRFFSMTFILGRLDFARYVLTDATVNLIGKRGSDIDYFVTQIAGNNSNSRFLTYSALFVIATVDLVLDWNRVAMHWNILKGQSYANKSDDSHARINIHPCFAFGSIGVSATVLW